MQAHPTTISPLRARIRAEVRTGILDAAERVFSEEGLEGGRMEHVALRAGVAVGTLYNHFRDREALLASLLEARRRELLERVDSAVAAAGRRFQDQLTAFLDTIFEHIHEHRPFLSLVIQEEATALKLRLTMPREERTLAQLRMRAERLVALGLRQGALRRRGSDLWADLLVGSLHSLLLRELTHGRRAGAPAPGRGLLAYFLTGAGRASHA
jgi:AcrR family transcriptional regulator